MPKCWSLPSRRARSPRRASRRARVRQSERKVEAEFALDPRDKFLVALGGLRNHLLDHLARPPFKRQRGVGPGGVAKLPAVAIDDIADQVADNRGRESDW